MSAAGARALVDEARRVALTLRSEANPPSVGTIVVSGMLAEQLAKELSPGAAPGAVSVGDGLDSRCEVLVRVIAGDPSDADERLVRSADHRDVPVVVVQLWPQADWTRPFVLTPFVVECRAGEGFPVREIADRIVDASASGAVLASRVPVLAPAARGSLVHGAVVRSALLGLLGARSGSTRSLLALEQVRLAAQLRIVSAGDAVSGELPVLAGGATAVLAAGFGLRGVARSLRSYLPAPIVDAAVAAGGTWALGRVAQLVESRLPES